MFAVNSFVFKKLLIISDNVLKVSSHSSDLVKADFIQHLNANVSVRFTIHHIPERGALNWKNLVMLCLNTIVVMRKRVFIIVQIAYSPMLARRLTFQRRLAVSVSICIIILRKLQLRHTHLLHYLSFILSSFYRIKQFYLLCWLQIMNVKCLSCTTLSNIRFRCCRLA